MTRLEWANGVEIASRLLRGQDKKPGVKFADEESYVVLR